MPINNAAGRITRSGSPTIYYIKLRALYILFLYTHSFLIKFSGVLRHNYKRLKFLVFKFDKATSKNLNDEEHGKSENGESIKPLEELFSSYYVYFLKSSLSIMGYIIF